MTELDAIVLGSGHNSLVLTAYLAKEGLRVACIEPKPSWGGGLTTMELPAGSGFRHNVHSFFHRGITQAPWFRDLELERFGVRYLEPELNVAVISPTGQVLHWWRDFDQTCASIGRYSRHDAETLRKWRDQFIPICESILGPENQTPPLPPARRRELLTRSDPGRTLLHTSRLSPIEFVRREFEHPFVQAALLFFNGLREVDPYCRGFGHHVPALFASGRHAQMCVGGSKALADGLVAAIRHHGGRVLLNVTPHRILHERGVVRGVQAGGHLMPAKMVVSGLNPQQTFHQLLEQNSVSEAWSRRVSGFQYNLVAPLFALHVNLSAGPVLRIQDAHPEVTDALMAAYGVQNLSSLDDMLQHHRAGSIPAPLFWGSCPTRFDPSQAPQEKHTAFVWEKLPYRVGGNAALWDGLREQHADQLLQEWTRYAPNLSDAVIDRFAFSPLDVERNLPNMSQGDLLVGAFSNGQVGYQRPFLGAGNYRTEIQGLYLCGSCCHPGGNITGLPGYNCAQAICADLGIDASWAPPALEDTLPRGS